MAKKQKACPYTSIGGQALIEGIMMKSTDRTALAVRLPDGSIDISYLNDSSSKKKAWYHKMPVLRGVLAFIGSMKTGYQALMISADKSGYADDVNEESGETKKLGKGVWAVLMAIASVLAVVLCVVLFMLLPRLAVAGLERLFATTFGSLTRSLIEQVLKLIVFVAYILLVSFMKDIHRVFEYHGAEHKTIFCYEAKLPLTVENARRQSRFHPRCGTSFMILMIIISVFFSTLVQVFFKGVYNNVVIWTLIKMLLIPLICGCGYEVLRACGKHDNLFTRIVSAPGIWVQRITTKEPDDSMLEVAIAAMNEVIPERCNKAETPAVTADEATGKQADEVRAQPTDTVVEEQSAETKEQPSDTAREAQ